MFSPYCTHCQSRVLLGPRRIIAMESDDSGHQVTLRCLCGQVVRAAIHTDIREQRELRGAA